MNQSQVTSQNTFASIAQLLQGGQKQGLQKANRSPTNSPQQSSMLKSVENFAKGPMTVAEKTIPNFKAKTRIGKAFITGGKKGAAVQLTKEIGSEIKSFSSKESNQGLDKLSDKLIHSAGGKLSNIKFSRDENNNLRIDGKGGPIYRNGKFVDGVPKTLQDKLMQLPKQVAQARAQAAARTHQKLQERER